MDWNSENIAHISRLLGASIRGKRLQKNLSQEELVKLSGVSLPSINRLETGKGNTSLHNLLAILKSLGMADELRHVFTQVEESPVLMARSRAKKPQRVKRSLKDGLSEEAKNLHGNGKRINEL